MAIFDDIFKAYEVNCDKLLEYGVKKDNHFYILSKNLLMINLD